MDTIKRSLLAAVAGFALVASGAFAQNVDSMKTAPTSQAVQLSDAELDNITAGSVLMTHVVFNSGNASRPAVLGDAHVFCINCAGFPFPDVDHAHAIQTPSHTVFQCKGAGCALIPPPPGAR